MLTSVPITMCAEPTIKAYLYWQMQDTKILRKINRLVQG